MVIISCISLFIFYFLLKEIGNKKLAIIGSFIFAICPWHIMKSRWGLESNLFSDFILFFIYCLILGLKRKNKFLYYFSFILAGISAYSYATSYFFLPLFIIPLLIILIYKKEIKIGQAILSILIIGLITLPLILFVIINTFNLPQINLPFLTIPRLTVNRFETVTALSSNNFLINCFNNFCNSLKVLINQYDQLPWNAIKGIGTTYLFSIVFFIIGIIFSFFANIINMISNLNKTCKNNKDTNNINKKIIDKNKLEIKYSYILKLWLIICILLLFICEPNINRLNIIFIPILLYTALGIYFVIYTTHYKKLIAYLIILLYCIFFIIFALKYFEQNWDQYFTFEGNLEEAMHYIKSLDKDKIYITNTIKEPYIYLLFYNKESSTEFNNTVEYYNSYVEFRQVKHFNNYYIENIKNIKLEENKSCAYLINKNNFNNYNIDYLKFKITEFDKYIVIEDI